MNAHDVDPEARNRLYPYALTLEKTKVDTQFVTFTVGNGRIEVVTLASNWSLVNRAIIIDIWDSKTLVSAPDIVAIDTTGRPLSLPKRGLHPIPATGNWHPRNFSIEVTRENILALHFWVLRKGYPRTAQHIEAKFMDFFVKDWNQLLRR